MIAGIIYSVYSHTWINIIIAIVVFAVLFWMALKGGIAGGDAKFIAAIAVWFGYPDILYILAIGSLTAAIYGLCKLHKMGLLFSRISVMFRGLYLRLVYGAKVAISQNKIVDSEEILEEAVPFGPFIVMAAWLIYIGGIVWV